MEMDLVFSPRATYLSLIEGSVGTKMFKSCFFREKNKCKSTDVCEEGRFSCAYYVSCVLRLVGLVTSPVVTVNSLEKMMVNSGWYEIKHLISGSVIFWEGEKKSDNKIHRHVGFYAEGRCISNDTEDNVPAEHHPTFQGKRKIERIYFHPLIG